MTHHHNLEGGGGCDRMHTNTIWCKYQLCWSSLISCWLLCTSTVTYVQQSQCQSQVNWTAGWNYPANCASTTSPYQHTQVQMNVKPCPVAAPLQGFLFPVRFLILMKDPQRGSRAPNMSVPFRARIIHATAACHLSMSICSYFCRKQSPSLQ